ncbi:unnamed protein product, partial [Aphanomyces euteiches]
MVFANEDAYAANEDAYAANEDAYAANEDAYAANEDAYAANDPLKDNTKLKRYGKSMTKALVVVIGPIENVLTAFECPCIFALHLEETGDIKNYEAWKDEGVNKKSRPLPVILSGPGTGKSRMLIEMKKLLGIAAAEVVEDDSLDTRLKSAFEFRLDINHGSEPIEILDNDNP